MEQHQDFTFFWHRSSPFSMKYPSLFTYEGYQFMCVEQFVLYRQAILYGENKVADQILHLEKSLPQIDKDRFVHIDDTFLALFMTKFKAGEFSREKIKN